MGFVCVHACVCVCVCVCVSLFRLCPAVRCRKHEFKWYIPLPSVIVNPPPEADGESLVAVSIFYALNPLTGIHDV